MPAVKPDIKKSLYQFMSYFTIVRSLHTLRSVQPERGVSSLLCFKVFLRCSTPAKPHRLWVMFPCIFEYFTIITDYSCQSKQLLKRKVPLTAELALNCNKMDQIVENYSTSFQHNCHISWPCISVCSNHDTCLVQCALIFILYHFKQFYTTKQCKKYCCQNTDNQNQFLQ